MDRQNRRAEAEMIPPAAWSSWLLEFRSDEITEELSVGLFVTAEISGLAVDNIVRLPR